MSLIDDAQAAMLHLHALTVRLKDGYSPDPYAVLGAQSDLMRLHFQLGVEMCQKFGAKERGYLTRKIAQAKEHLHGRMHLKLTSKDAEESALVAVEKQFIEEVEAMELFELYRTLLKSLQTAFEHSRSVGSFLKDAERNPSPSQP